MTDTLYTLMRRYPADFVIARRTCEWRATEGAERKYSVDDQLRGVGRRTFEERKWWAMGDTWFATRFKLKSEQSRRGLISKAKLNVVPDFHAKFLISIDLTPQISEPLLNKLLLVGSERNLNGLTHINTKSSNEFRCSHSTAKALSPYVTFLPPHTRNYCYYESF